MYTVRHRQRIVHGECAHLTDGGSKVCSNYAQKYWLFLEEGPEMKLQITLVVPVCNEHKYSIRASMNCNNSWLSRNDWDLVDRDSASFQLIEDTLY